MKDDRIVLTPELEAWRQRNPLWNWMRKKGRGSINQVKTATGVTSRAAVYAWTEGTARPTTQRLVALEKLTRITFRQWAQWWAQEPKTPTLTQGD